MTESLYIVMPAYNESENIELVVKQWHPIIEKIGNNSRLVIVDDSSKDNTYEILLKLKESFPRLEAITKPNTGHGITCLFAYKYAINNKADWIFQTDSDGQTDPNEFWTFWNKRKEYDFLIGLRNSRKDGLDRIFVTNVLRFLLFLVFKKNIPDANTPYRLVKNNVLKHYISLIPSDSFLSNVIMSALIVKDNVPSIWIPINFKPRQGGTNSINFKKIINIGLKGIKDFCYINKSIKSIKKNN